MNPIQTVTLNIFGWLFWLGIVIALIVYIPRLFRIFTGTTTLPRSERQQQAEKHLTVGKVSERNSQFQAVSVNRCPNCKGFRDGGTNSKQCDCVEIE